MKIENLQKAKDLVSEYNIVCSKITNLHNTANITQVQIWKSEDPELFEEFRLLELKYREGIKKDLEERVAEL